MDEIHCTHDGIVELEIGDGRVAPLFHLADPDWTALGSGYAPTAEYRVRLTDWSGPATVQGCDIEVWVAARYSANGIARVGMYRTYRWLTQPAPGRWTTEPWDEAIARCPSTKERADPWGAELLDGRSQPSAAGTCAAAYARPVGVGLVLPDAAMSQESLWGTRCERGVLYGGVHDDLGGVILGTGRLGTPGGAIIEVPDADKRCGDWTKRSGELVYHLIPVERAPDWTAWLATHAGPVRHRAPPTADRCGLRPGEVVDWTRDPPAPDLERCLRDAAGLTGRQRLLTLRAPD